VTQWYTIIIILIWGENDDAGVFKKVFISWAKISGFWHAKR